MGFFGSILSKLGIGDGDAPSAAPAGIQRAPNMVEAEKRAAEAPAPVPVPEAAPAAPAAPAPIAVVDVVAKLEQLAAARKQKLNWRVSIVDLLTLLDIDSSYAARKELAVELGCPAELMTESAKMNMWLHKTVLAKIAQNGGNVPQDLLD
ncbi:MAG: DUF3597 domain-containing protein [Acidobacteria bacterium]|nr:DUF3597 domain-containing protein [Acidobacteriota bacterium]